MAARAPAPRTKFARRDSRRVEDPADGVVDGLALRERLVAALVGDDPEAGAEETDKEGEYLEGDEVGGEREPDGEGGRDEGENEDELPSTDEVSQRGNEEQANTVAINLLGVNTV